MLKNKVHSITLINTMIIKTILGIQIFLNKRQNKSLFYT